MTVFHAFISLLVPSLDLVLLSILMHVLTVQPYNLSTLQLLLYNYDSLSLSILTLETSLYCPHNT